MQFSILKMLEEAVEEHFELFIAFIAIVAGAAITHTNENAEVVGELRRIDDGLLSIYHQRKESWGRFYNCDGAERDDCWSDLEEDLCNQRQKVVKGATEKYKHELEREVAAARGYSMP